MGLVGILSGHGTLTGTVSRSLSVEPYDGPYGFTPSREAQIIQIEGMKATADIVIEAIPQNYGLITWNGSVLTVS